MLLNVPSGARCQSVGGVGHKGDLRRAHAKHQVHKLLGGVAFNVEFLAQNGAQLQHVGTADVALVGTRVHGDAVGSEAFAVESHFLYVWDIASACVADGCHFVDVDTQVGHFFTALFLLLYRFLSLPLYYGWLYFFNSVMELVSLLPKDKNFCKISINS